MKSCSLRIKGLTWHPKSYRVFKGQMRATLSHHCSNKLIDTVLDYSVYFPTMPQPKHHQILSYLLAKYALRSWLPLPAFHISGIAFLPLFLTPYITFKGAYRVFLSKKDAKNASSSSLSHSEWGVNTLPAEQASK